MRTRTFANGLAGIMCYVPNTSKCCFFFLFLSLPFFPFLDPCCPLPLWRHSQDYASPISRSNRTWLQLFRLGLKAAKTVQEKKKIGSLFAGPYCATTRVKKHVIAALFWQAVIQVIKQFVAAPTINRFCVVPMNSLLCKRNSIRLDSTVQLALYCIGCHCHFYTVKHLVFHSPVA